MKISHVCPWCGNTPDYLKANSLRQHVKRHHPEIEAYTLERYLVEKRYPDLDIDAIVQRYKDRLETVIGLQYKGIFLKYYLNFIGVARSAQADKSLMRFLKKGNIETEAQLKKVMEEELIGKFRTASPEVRFNGFLNRDIAVLKKKGVPDELIPAVKALKLIKFTKKQIAAAIEAEQKEAEASTDTE